MSIVQALMAGYGDIYIARGVTFDGSNDYLARGADFTGNADGKVGTVSFWINIKNNVTDFDVFSSNDRIKIRYIGSASGGVFRITLNNSSNTQRVLIQNISLISISSGWVNVLFSWDAENTVGHVYINDTDDVDSASVINDTLDYTESDFVVGANTGFADKMNADLADFYFNNSEYLDISVEANRRKFIDDNGKPVFLGNSLELPTGTSPILGLSLSKDAAVSTFATNKGTGGGMTLTGALTEASTSPSD